MASKRKVEENNKVKTSSPWYPNITFVTYMCSRACSSCRWVSFATGKLHQFRQDRRASSVDRAHDSRGRGGENNGTKRADEVPCLRTQSILVGPLKFRMHHLDFFMPLGLV